MIGDLLQKDLCQHSPQPPTVVFRAPDPMAGHCQPTPPPETPGCSQASLAQSLVGSLLLSPWSLCTGFICALQESVSPVLWEFYNQIPLASKVKFPGGSQSLCQIPRLGNLLWALEDVLLTVQKLLWYNCSPICGSPTWWLYSEANSDLLQEDLCHMLPDPGLLYGKTYP